MQANRTVALAAALAVVAACGVFTAVWVLGVVSTPVHRLGPALLCVAPVLAAGAAVAVVLRRRQRA